MLRPKEGRYKFLSLSKSARGKKLFVGERVMRNHNMEKDITGDIFRKFLIKASNAVSQNITGMILKKESHWFGKS